MKPEKKVTLIVLIFILSLSILIPSFSKIKNKINQRLIEVKLEEEKEKIILLEKEKLANEIETTNLRIKDVVNKIVTNKKENGDLDETVEVKIKDAWESELIITFPTPKEVVVTSNGPDKIKETSDDIVVNKSVFEEEGNVKKFYNFISNKLKN